MFCGKCWVQKGFKKLIPRYNRFWCVNDGVEWYTKLKLENLLSPALFLHLYLEQKPDINRFNCSNRDRLGFDAEIQINFRTVCFRSFWPSHHSPHILRSTSNFIETVASSWATLRSFFDTATWAELLQFLWDYLKSMQANCSRFSWFKKLYLNNFQVKRILKQR